MAQQLLPQQLLSQIVKAVLDDYSSDFLNVLADKLQHNQEPLLAFCNMYDLGGWIYDNMSLQDFDIVSEVCDTAERRREEELESIQESEESKYELRTQGAL